MAQAKVTSYYCTRKRAYENKILLQNNFEATTDNVKSILLQAVSPVITDAKEVSSVIKTNKSKAVRWVQDADCGKPIENVVEPFVTKIESKSKTKEPSTKPKPTRKGRSRKVVAKFDSLDIVEALLGQSKHTSEISSDAQAICIGNADTTPQEGIPEETKAKPKARARKAKPAETKTKNETPNIKTRTRRGKVAESKSNNDSLDIRDVFKSQEKKAMSKSNSKVKNAAENVLQPNDQKAETKSQGSKTEKTTTKKPKSVSVKSRSVKAVNAKKETSVIRSAFQEKAEHSSQEILNCEHVTSLLENKDKLSNIVISVNSPSKVQGSTSCDSDLQHSPKRSLLNPEVQDAVEPILPPNGQKAVIKVEGAKTQKKSAKKPRPVPVKSRSVKAVNVEKDTSDVRSQTKAEKFPEEALNGEQQITTLVENKELPNVVMSLDSPSKTQSSTSYESDLQRSPKRCLPDSELKTLHGKKKCLKFGFTEGIHAASSSTTSPQKEVQIVVEAPRQQLNFDNQPGTLSAQRNPDLKATLSLQEKQKLLQCGKLDELKKSIARFENSSAVLKSFQNSKCKITSPLPALEPRSTPEVLTPMEAMKKSPAYQRFHSLATPEQPSLSFPYKYKLLAESFRCSDSVMCILHNRKEVCTFEKLKSSVQDMMKKNFSKQNLGQIKTVFPSAYHYNQEKISMSFINLKPGVSRYQLVISPNLTDCEENQIINSGIDLSVGEDETSSLIQKGEKQNVKEASSAFIQMNPTWLIKRRKIFHSNLLNIVKGHHQKFLETLHPNIGIPQESITRWHPKFPLDSVPDIPPALLPEAEDMKKGSTAADVLNIIRGKAGEKVEKALQSVAESHGTSTEGSSNSRNEDLVKRGALKGICNDLLQKIRAREAAKIVMEMTRPQEDHKKSEMVQRIPEIVRIIRNYFITARKAAVSVDEATQKIIDSYHSSLSPDDVRQHLQLIAELFPSWLYLISISKGLFLKIDKNKNINALLDNMPKLKT